MFHLPLLCEDDTVLKPDMEMVCYLQQTGDGRADTRAASGHKEGAE